MSPKLADLCIGARRSSSTRTRDPTTNARLIAAVIHAAHVTLRIVSDRIEPCLDREQRPRRVCANSNTVTNYIT